MQHSTLSTQNQRMRRGVLFVVASAALFGVMPILIKLAYGEGVNTKTLLALRFSIAAVGMWLVWALQTRRSSRRRSFRPGVLLPLVGMGPLVSGSKSTAPAPR